MKCIGKSCKINNFFIKNNELKKIEKKTQLKVFDSWCSNFQLTHGKGGDTKLTKETHWCDKNSRTNAMRSTTQCGKGSTNYVKRLTTPMWERQQHLCDKHNNINVGRARTST
jgi:hypothetical protein